MILVQVFGLKKSADTRKALRFFSERRVPVHFVDFAERPAARGELIRFVQKVGVDALVDRESKHFLEIGLRYTQMSGERWLERLCEDPLLLRMPLVRHGNSFSIGVDETTWKSWLSR